MFVGVIQQIFDLFSGIQQAVKNQGSYSTLSASCAFET